MKKLLLTLFTVCLLCNANAQTLVNVASTDTTSNANLNYPFQAGFKVDSNRVVILSSVANSLTGSTVAVTLYKNTGMVSQWQVTSSFPDSEILTPTAACQSGNYIYGCFGYNQLGTGSGFGVAKFSIHNGTEPWSDVYNSSGYYQLPAAIIADSLGKYIYVAGVQQTSPNTSEVFITKIDSAGNQKWTATYDSAGMYSGAVAMVLNTGGATITFTGFSGNAWSNWDFITASVRTDSGIMTKPSFTAAGAGYSTPAGLVKDYSNHTYIAGTINAGSSSSRIRVIAYDTSFSQRWERTWGNADSLADSASRVVMDFDDNILITGYTTSSNNVKQLLVLKYNTADSLLWSRIVSAPNPNYAMAGNDINSDDSLNVYVSGKVWNGSNWDYVTIAFDQNGNILWEKTYNGAGTNDVANDIITDNTGDVFVSGISSHDTTATYLTLEYQQLTLSKGALIDSITHNPIYLTGQVILKVDSSAVIRSAVNNPNITFGSLSTFLNTWMVDSLNAHLPGKTTYQLAKIFTNLKTTDTVSISRLRQRVPIPDFWSTFVLTFSGSQNESSLCYALNKLHPKVQYTGLDRLAILDGAYTPDDHFYNNPISTLDSQFSLHPNYTYPGCDINVEEAWAYSTGKPYIKVGVVDDGLLLTHQDFQIYPHTNSSNSTSIAVGGWNYIDDDSLAYGVLGDPGGYGHGTKVGGIIGAVRNNQNGIAGIAGGNDTVPGVSLYGFMIFTTDINGSTVTSASAHTIANAIVETSTQTPDSSYGWGMNILNNSYSFAPSDAGGYSLDSNWQALIDAYHYANRNQVVLPAAAGNGSQTAGDLELVFPAAFDSIWLIITGGTGISGTWYGDNYNQGTYQDASQACNGAGMDIAAPDDYRLIYTTVTDGGANGGSFYYFDGTSAATAHVSGIAALLASYMNDSVSNYKNLAPEDVEYMIEHTATDVDAPGYDTLTGWGRINGGGALSMADTSKRKLHHFDSDTVGVTNTYSLVNGGIHVWLTEQARNNNNTGQTFAAEKYLANVYKVSCTMSLPYNSTDTLAAFWARCSSSFTYPYFNNDSELIPHERIFIQSMSPTSTTITGYIYQLRDTLNDTIIGWLPMDTAHAKTANFAISIVVGDSIRTPIDSILSSITTVKTENSQLAVFPNPANDNIVVQAASNCQGNVKLGIYNVQGVQIGSIFNGGLGDAMQKFPYNTTALAAGMYFVTMQTDCETNSLKFVKF